MKYNCGMYGGSFNPPHLGHIRCIIEAANQCKRLIVVISNGVNRNEIDIKTRYRWLYQLTKHIGNVSIFILNDEAKTKADYSEEMWHTDAESVKQFAGEEIDAVFCGSDYDKDSFGANAILTPELNIIIRNNTSSTKIRDNVFENWEMIPNIVRPYYVKKVLLIGGESTGKSTLTINLANYYNTNYLEEVGRDISERSGTDLMMLPDDFTDILLQHKTREIEAIKSSNRILFEDTDCLITKFYIDFLDGKEKENNIKLANAISQLNSYDLILFLEPDVDFVQDGDRSEVIAANREKFSSRIKEIYLTHGFNFEIISGDYQQRFKQAVHLIDKLLKAGTKIMKTNNKSFLGLTTIQWFEVLAVIGFTIYFALIDEQNPWWYLLISSTAAICGILCVVLCVAGKKSQFYWGFANIIAYIIVAWINKYYGEVMLNGLYYLPTQFVGLYLWKKHYNSETETVKCKKMKPYTFVLFTAVSVIVIWLYNILLKGIGGNATLLDSTSTVLSLTANALMVLRYREQWLLWFIVDAATVVMWFIAGDWIMTTMWSVYLFNAGYGMYLWTKMNRTDNITNE